MAFIVASLKWNMDKNEKQNFCPISLRRSQMSLSSFDMNLLRVLDALLSTRSTTRAAHIIGLSQPAVSSALGRLRNALGDPLFVRQGRNLVPTDFARALVEPVRAILSQTETLLSAPTPFAPAEARHVFRILGHDFFAELVMPALAAHLSRHAPGISIEFRNMNSDSPVACLEENLCDLAILPETEVPDWITQLTVCAIHFSVVVRADHPALTLARLAPGQTFPLKVFRQLPHVTAQQLQHWYAAEEAGEVKAALMSLPSFSAVAAVVAKSDTVSVMPDPLARHFALRDDLAFYPSPVPQAPMNVSMLWHNRVTMNPAHFWLRTLVMEKLSPLCELRSSPELDITCPLAS